ncbi:MAG: hypothetical protein OEZ16_12890, partial [Chromatiales bacterium]|nr:hypothetical protein [Chromatiales bacterium]
MSETPNSSSTINSKSADQGEAATDSSLIHAESGKSRDLSQQSGPTEKLSSSSKSKRTKSERDEQLAEELAAEQLALKLAREKADNRKKADKKKRRKAELAEARRLEQELEAARRLEEEIAAAEMAMRVESAPSSTLTEASTTQSSEPPLKQTPTQTPTQTPE